MSVRKIFIYFLALNFQAILNFLFIFSLHKPLLKSKFRNAKNKNKPKLQIKHAVFLFEGGKQKMHPIMIFYDDKMMNY